MIKFVLLVCLIFATSVTEKRTEMSKMIALDFEVFGVVQGVFFRKVSKPYDPSKNFTVAEPAGCVGNAIARVSELEYTQKRGKELGLKGWCMNTSNGTVVGQLEGEKKQVEEMKRWLRHTGSPQSRIDKTEFRNEREIAQPSFFNFEIRK